MDVAVSPAGALASPPPPPPPPPLSVNLFPRELGGVADFFPFHDLELIRSDDDEGFFFHRYPIVPAAAGSADGPPRIWLFPAGCRLGDGGPGTATTNGGGGSFASTAAPDCPRACRKAETLFASPETFYNCAALSSIAYWTREAGAYSLPDEARRNASLVLAGRDLADFDDRAVLSSFVACAQAACGGDAIRKPCDASVKALSPHSSPPDVLRAIGAFCPQLEVEVNPDIFGPGVLISYLLQVCFASLLYLFLKAFTLWVRLSQGRRGERCRSASDSNSASSFLGVPRRITRIESIIWRDSSALSRTSIAIATTLVEFQEAQCWFVFAIQIASILAIVVNSQEGTFWGEIVVNAAVAFHVSQNGILPMFLIQLCLHNEGIRNWHTFLGFFAEYLLAIVATSQKIHFRDAFELFRKERKIDACGGNPSPRSYCAAMHGVDGLNLSFFPRPYLYKVVFLVLDTIAIGILLLDQLSWTLRTHRLTRDLKLGRHRLGRGPTGRLKRAWVRLKSIVWSVLELTYLVINLLYMVSLIKVFSNDSFEASKWSYGQIIAMTVWGPVIVKLFDLVFSGPPKNGTRLNSGPPRLRIDNVINHRLGTSADEELEDESQLPDLEKKMAETPKFDLRRRRMQRGRDAEETNDEATGVGDQKREEVGLPRRDDDNGAPS
ncbi:hypothetical protein CDD83_11091 [Cordyceps sp. RAO-2017]|nr:hypothetical protein CDD83_11091 [Cordyceps sp. RAO-2017]